MAAIKMKHDKAFVYRNIIILSLAACLNFTGFSALQNLQSSLNPKLGFTTLCILYATYALTLLFLPNLTIYKIGYKWTFVLSVTGYATFTLVQFYPTPFAMAIAAICVGASSSLFWVSSSSILTLLAYKLAKLSRSDRDGADNINQKFFAVFYIGYRMAQITGNLTSSLVLSSSFHEVSYSNLHGYGDSRGKLCGVDYCPPAPSSLLTDHAEHNKLHNTRTVFSIFVGTATGGIIFAVVFLSSELNDDEDGDEDYLDDGSSASLKDGKEDTENGVDGSRGDKVKTESDRKHSTGNRDQKNKPLTLVEKLKEIFLLMRETNLLKLIPLMMGVGAIHSFTYGDLTKNFVTCAYGIEYVGFTMICYGVATCLSSLLIQAVVRRIGYLSVILSGHVALMGLFVWLQLWDAVREPRWSAYLTALVLGASEIAVTSQAHGFYGVLYPDKKSSAYSICKLSIATGEALAFAYGNYLCQRTKLFIVMCYYAVGVLLGEAGLTRDSKCTVSCLLKTILF